MNDLFELQRIQIENFLRRHYLHELLGSNYERLICFMQTILGTMDKPNIGDSINRIEENEYPR